MDQGAFELVRLLAQNLTASFLAAAIILAFLLDFVVTKRRHDAELAAAEQRRVAEVALVQARCDTMQATIDRLLGERNAALAQLQADTQKVYTFADAIGDLRESVKDLTQTLSRRRA